MKMGPSWKVLHRVCHGSDSIASLFVTSTTKLWTVENHVLELTMMVGWKSLSATPSSTIFFGSIILVVQMVGAQTCWHWRDCVERISSGRGHRG